MNRVSLRDLFRRQSPRARFAQRFIEALREHGEARPLEFDPGEFAIRVGPNPADPERIHALQGAFDECERSDETEHASILVRYTSAANRSKPPQDYASARDRLRVTVADRTFPAIQALRRRLEPEPSAGSPDLQLAHAPIGADLVACIVASEGPAMQFVTLDSLRSWGVSLRSVIANAAANLRAAVDFTLTDDDGLLRSETGDSFDSGRLLFEDDIRHMPLRGAPVALVPDRRTLLLAGSEDAGALRRMVEVGWKRLEEADSLVSGRPVLLNDTGWTAFHPPEHVSIQFENLARLYDGRHYSEQQELLEKLYARESEDVYVASFEIAEREGEPRYVAWTTWSKGVPSLLPEADEVAFYDPGPKTVRFADWNAVMLVMGDRMTATEEAPRRWWVDTFPSNDELVAMGARVVDTGN